MYYRFAPPAFGLLLLVCAQLHADTIEPTELEQRFSDVQQRYASPNLVQPVQYVASTGPAFMPPPAAAAPMNAPPEPLPIPPGVAPYSTPVYIPPQNPSPTDQDVVYVMPGGNACCNKYRNSNWFFGLDFIPTQSFITRGKFGNWPDDVSLALRLNLGYEDESGYGSRLRWWAFGQEADTPGGDVDLGASTFQFDLYKRLFIEDTELVLGAGPAGGHLRFELSDDSSSRFNGGGISVFAEGFQPTWRWAKIDLGTVGRARLSLMEGDWDDSTGTVIPRTHHDSMSVIEAAWGLELRRRYGQCEEHYWYIDLLFEYQRWDSAWMAEFADTAVAFHGVDLNFGIAW